MSMLRGSSTVKQGASDFMLNIGMSEDPNEIKTRYLYTPKNKFTQQDGARKDTRVAVTFNYETARYINPTETIQL